LRKPIAFNLDFEKDELVVTFEGLINNSTFVKQIHFILQTLQNALATPVDIEFASNGKDFYLLQCRPQSYSKYDAPSPIPSDIPVSRTIFTANRFVSNGTVPAIKFIVYIDPEHYNKINSKSELQSIGRAVGALNQILPRRQFILMGPGRWGSRGDIKLGVNVTYSDINNTAVLIEIARKKGNYVPDLSFGTHFFQDLVEASIRYLPLYPDEPGIIFNEDFLLSSPNTLIEILPSYSYLSDTLRVIEVPQVTDGLILRVLMNADLDKAVGVLMPDAHSSIAQTDQAEHSVVHPENHWRWRKYMAEKIADQIDAKKFGVKGLYISGSTKKTTAQAGSDIDLIVHFTGNNKQKNDLKYWLEGWSLAIDEMNFLRTGFKAGGLLDIHLVNSKEMEDLKKMADKLKINVDDIEELRLNHKN